MTDVKGLKERLKTYRPTNEWGDPVHHMIVDEALARIEELEGRVRALDAEVERYIEAYKIAHDQATANGAEANRLRATLSTIQDKTDD